MINDAFVTVAAGSLRTTVLSARTFHAAHAAVPAAAAKHAAATDASVDRGHT
ncbi:hypothetical protein [Mycobacterium sp. Marseille-P9652]|uniref:hypothetical protein n=1 Tax=Mycobacterium sp. Marseille-P9652 TaxID=2654950 RepID=UPI0018D035F4|nr:hypothetical protein [Mycobacterium sp. Marseille-P9652]